ncbi:hypothetical protein, partial [Pseudophaeobacter arcticus]|uniref:hypothetical protein n=1 Tax=Pseudophaeobacter arcticus TaxID=385492 RepID=UPI0024932A41
MTDIALQAEPQAEDKPAPVRTHIGVAPLVALVTLIIAGDQLLWAVLPGISLPLFLVIVAAWSHALCFRLVAPKSAVLAWSVLCAALLPTVDVVQPLSIAFAVAGLIGNVLMAWYSDRRKDHVEQRSKFRSWRDSILKNIKDRSTDEGVKLSTEAPEGLSKKTSMKIQDMEVQLSEIEKKLHAKPDELDK